MYTPIDKPNGPFTMFQDCITNNAIRHMKRAGMHAANGNFDYADRSAEKAIRNFKREAEFNWIEWCSRQAWSK